MSSSQKYVLAQFARASAGDDEAQPHWAAILLAASDDRATTGVEERTGASETLVNTVLEKWKAAQEDLAKAESSGPLALQSAIESIFENYEDFEDECFCCCDCDEEDSLSAYDLEMLAGKVYNLLRMELQIERERLGYAYFNRN
jgi:hypothetical protein